MELVYGRQNFKTHSPMNSGGTFISGLIKCWLLWAQALQQGLVPALAQAENRYSGTVWPSYTVGPSLERVEQVLCPSAPNGACSTDAVAKGKPKVR